jgi:outer membrane receptor for ferrienterochelin and colicin
VQSTFTWYGKQQPKKYNYKGQPAVGSETDEVSPYSIVRPERDLGRDQKRQPDRRRG